EQSVVILGCGVGVEAAEGQQVPVIIANAASREDLFRAIWFAHQSSASIVADPVGENDFSFQRFVLLHGKTQSAAGAIDISEQENNDMRTQKVLGTTENEILAVDIVPSIILREESLNSHLAFRPGVAEINAELIHFAIPFSMAI